MFGRLAEPADLTGDGIPDLITSGFDPFDGNHYGVWIVPGPLRGRTIDPAAEAVAVVVGGYNPRVFEVTGDGLPDLLVDVRYDGWEFVHVVEGPLPTVTVAADHPWYNGLPVDLDGDGTFEQQRRSGRGWEPEEVRVDVRVAGDPDGEPVLSVVPSCRWPDEPEAYSLWYDSPRVEPLYAMPDLDGDDARDLLWAGLAQDGQELACSWFWLPLDARGVVDPVTDDDARRARLPRILGDQDGDGVRDACWPYSVLAGPLDLSGPVVTGRTIHPRPWASTCGTRVPFDLTVDGIGDFEKLQEVDDVNRFVIVAGGVGPAAPASPGEPVAVLPTPLAEHVYVVEDGVAAVVFLPVRAGEVRVHDLGPAIALARDE